MIVLPLYLHSNMGSQVETLAEILESAPGNWFIRWLLIDSLVAEGRDAEARILLAEPSELPSRPYFLYYAARAHEALEPARAVEILRRLVEMDPGNAAHYGEEAGRIIPLHGLPDQCVGDSQVNSHPIPCEQETSFECRWQMDRDRQGSARKQELTRESIISVFAACLVMLGVCVWLLVVGISTYNPAKPQILAKFETVDDLEPELETKEMVRVEHWRPRPASATLAMNLVASQSPADLSVVSSETDSTRLGMVDMGLELGNSMIFGGGGGGADSVMFFGSKSRGKRFLFILDASGSMTHEQIELRDRELRKTLKQLTSATYHVLIFGGGAYFAEKGWGTNGVDPLSYHSPESEYRFSLVGTGFALIDPQAFEPPGWLKADSKQVLATLREVRRSGVLFSTDWDNALRMGHMMEPPPDVIYFMSDGKDPELDIDAIVENNQKRGKPKINCLAMQTGFGAAEFAEIARRSGGQFLIVDKRGKPIDGFDYLHDPEKYARRL